jgi:RNA polymerase sigma-70 factor (ECF subfamily)
LSVQDQTTLHRARMEVARPQLRLADEGERRELRSLVDRAARGDAEALRLLYDRLAPRAMAIAVRVLGARGEAEEVVQEVFLEVWRRARDYDATRGEPAAWITMIVRSRALDRLRTRATSERTAASSAREPAPPPSPSPAEDAEKRMERERVAAAMATLPGEQRVAVELAYWEGLSHSEIAERTGAPLGTVKTRIKLAVEKLGQMLRGSA